MFSWHSLGHLFTRLMGYISACPIDCRYDAFDFRIATSELILLNWLKTPFCPGTWKEKKKAIYHSS
jgi:hypothetical protein